MLADDVDDASQSASRCWCVDMLADVGQMLAVPDVEPNDNGLMT